MKNLENWNGIPSAFVHRRGVLKVKFNADGSLIASSGEDRTVKILKVLKGNQLEVTMTFEGHKVRSEIGLVCLFFF
jgi:WD40 repeat protein